MTEFILGVDLDGVVAKYTGGLARVVEEDRGLQPGSLPEPTGWDFPNWDFVSGDFMKYHTELVVNQRGFLHLETMEGAADTLKTLSKEGVWIRIVTHRLVIPQSHGPIASDTVSWLDSNEIPYRDICFMESKFDVRCDLYVDDAPHNVIALREAGNDVVTFDQPYNQHLPGPRVTNWWDLGNLVLQKQSAWKNREAWV